MNSNQHRVMLRRKSRSNECVNKEPLLIIEVSKLRLKDIVARAVDRKLVPRVVKEIKSKKVSLWRLILGSPDIYIVHPCETQAYLSRDMRHPHYQINLHEEGCDLAALKQVVSRARESVNGNSTRIVEIFSYMPYYRDSNLWVVNNPNVSSIDWSVVTEKLANETKDPERNNYCRDLGFAGQRNSRREPKYLGLSRPNKMTGTMDEWSQSLFVAMTAFIDSNFDGIKDGVYNDLERNKIFAGTIHEDNRIEAMRLARTDTYGGLLDIHCDDANCVTDEYKVVVGISRHCMEDSVMSRYVLVTYGKNVANEHMIDRMKHGNCIKFLCNVYDALPAKQKSQCSDVYPPVGCSRVEYKYTLLDKGIYYSLFATAIALLVETYPTMKHDLLMMCAFLSNVCMSECADHFWQILCELRSNSRLFTKEAFFESDPFMVGFNLMEEIFRRKRSDNLPYPVKKRHQPAVNHPPSKIQMDNTIRSTAMLIQELHVVQPAVHCTANALHYFGKAIDFLIREAFGAGHLTAQHTIGVAACLRLVPSLFLAVAEVGMSTKSWVFIHWAFKYDEGDTAHEDMNTMLRAVACCLCIPIMHAEELICIATKAMAPTETFMSGRECCMDYSKAVINLKKNSYTGDVIFSNMRLFRLHDNQLHYLTRDGLFLEAGEVMSESLFASMMDCLQPDFWQKIKGRKGKYHYRRKKADTSIKSIREYFIDTNDEGDEYVPRPTKSRAKVVVRGVNERHPIAFGLLGPAFSTVAMGFDGREPLCLPQIAWLGMGGVGFYSKVLFRFTRHELKLVRPPVVHPKFKIQSAHEIFWSCTLVPQKQELDLKLNNDLYWVDPKFELMSCRLPEEGVLAPKEWRRSIVFWDEEDFVKAQGQRWPNKNRERKLAIDHSERKEPSYVWNSYRSIPCEDSPYGRVMVYRDKQRCSEAASAEFIFTQRHLLDLNNPQVRSLFFMAGSKENAKMKTKRIRVENTEEVHVYYNLQAQRSRTERLPFLIAIKYERGGRVYYFCDSGGQRISAPLLRRPVPLATKRESNEETMYEFHCILSHRVKADSNSPQKKIVIWVTLLWVDGSRSEEPMEKVFQTSPLEVAHYAESKDLLNVSGWNKVFSLSKALARVPERDIAPSTMVVTIFPSFQARKRVRHRYKR